MRDFKVKMQLFMDICTAEAANTEVTWLGVDLAYELMQSATTRISAKRLVDALAALKLDPATTPANFGVFPYFIACDYKYRFQNNLSFTDANYRFNDARIVQALDGAASNPRDAAYALLALLPAEADQACFWGEQYRVVLQGEPLVPFDGTGVRAFSHAEPTKKLQYNANVRLRVTRCTDETPTVVFEVLRYPAPLRGEQDAKQT